MYWSAAGTGPCPGSCHALEPGRKGLVTAVPTYLSLIDSLLSAASSIVVIAEFLRKRRGHEDVDAASDDQAERSDHQDDTPEGDQDS